MNTLVSKVKYAGLVISAEDVDCEVAIQSL